MDQVCPLCNRLSSYVVQCPDCEKEMEDTGPIQDYFDDYSPYLERSLTELADGVTSDYCLHLFSCKQCKRFKQVPIKRIFI
ncbi:hypothetical protein [Alkaliphilus crotonatoxidans]